MCLFFCRNEVMMYFLCDRIFGIVMVFLLVFGLKLVMVEDVGVLVWVLDLFVWCDWVGV